MKNKFRRLSNETLINSNVENTCLLLHVIFPPGCIKYSYDHNDKGPLVDDGLWSWIILYHLEYYYTPRNAYNTHCI